MLTPSMPLPQAESASHQLGRLRGSLASFDPFPAAFRPPVLSPEERDAWVRIDDAGHRAE